MASAASWLRDMLGAYMALSSIPKGRRRLGLSMGLPLPRVLLWLQIATTETYDPGQTRCTI